MKARLPNFKPGDVTKDVYAGDGVVECEFIQYLNHGMMLFYDKDTKCFRRAFWEVMDDEGNGKPVTILNGWDCSRTASEYIKRA